VWGGGGGTGGEDVEPVRAGGACAGAKRACAAPATELEQLEAEPGVCTRTCGGSN
jgi:hypothetical protein